MTTRKQIVKQAQSWIGKKEADGSYKIIINTYNEHKPLARNYRVKVGDAWCATFASACAIATNATDIIPTECGCGQMIELFKKQGCWVESDSYVPSPGDYIFYDWQDTGKGDNKGWPDHVGIVEKVENNIITVIEGNYKDAVSRRQIKVNAKNIRGYGVPKYAAEPKVKVDYADFRDISLAGSYYTTSGLNLRTGAGTDKDIITEMPKGSTVECYGYYSVFNNVKWLFIAYGDVTGFCSSRYLAR